MATEQNVKENKNDSIEVLGYIKLPEGIYYVVSSPDGIQKIPTPSDTSTGVWNTSIWDDTAQWG